LVEEPSTTRLNRLVDATQEAAPWVCTVIVPPKLDSFTTIFQIQMTRLSRPPWGRIFLVFRSKNGPQAERLRIDVHEARKIHFNLTDVLGQMRSERCRLRR